MNKVILLKNRPKATPQLSDFEIVDEKMPEVMEGQVLLKTLYISVDPYLRGRMNEGESYVAAFKLNEPIKYGIVAEVVE